MKPKKLTYNERNGTFHVYGEAFEGAERATLGNATEEFVIKAILEKEMLLQAEVMFDEYIAQLKIDNEENSIRMRNDIINSFNKRCDMIHDQLNVIIMKKKWWQIWRKKNGLSK